MYIHHLGNQNVERLNRYGNTDTVKASGATTGGVDFAAQLQKAAANQNRTEEAGTDTLSAADTNACCEQCKLNTQLIARMMTQNLYMQTGLGGLGTLAGLSTYNSSARAALAYQSMSGMLGSVFGSI